MSATTVSAQDESEDSDGSEEKATLTFLHPPKGLNRLSISTARGAPTFRANVNGKEVCALFDTGSTRTIVDLGLAREKGLRISELTTPARALGVDIEARRVWSVSVEVLGQFRMQSCLIGIDMPDLFCADGTPLQFVLGREFINAMTIVVNDDAKSIAFHKSGSVTPNDGVVRLDWVDNTIAVQLNGRDAVLEVDTGSSSDLLISAERFGDYFANDDVVSLPPSNSASGRRESDVGIRDVDYSVNGVVATGVAKRIDGWSKDAVGNLGYPFFRDGLTIFDAGRNVIWTTKQVSEEK